MYQLLAKCLRSNFCFEKQVKQYLQSKDEHLRWHLFLFKNSVLFLSLPPFT